MRLFLQKQLGMEEKKQPLIACQDIYDEDGSLNSLLIIECKEGKIERTYQARYPNHYFAADQFIERFRILFSCEPIS